ncbi:pyruvate dehydrogenase (acetyl-transferring) E1 component subunit alpha [Candidatus Gracilibacteria bacterium]|nr:pyruvate dehydrogenase (acetyl-transferring) E1 component subunit alpha [Candidatus Gracilibacteria bacterium]
MSIIDSHNPLTDPMFQIMDQNGVIVRPELMPKSWTPEKIKEAYASMILLRMMDTKFSNLQRQGRCGTYPSIEGQEACQIGSGWEIEKSDWIFPAFRESGICYIHGQEMEKILLYWMGNEWGSHTDACVAPPSIPVGSHMLHAAGYSWAMKLQKKPVITVSYFGDGATSEGDFYEAMNFAGVFKLGTIFFCQNNQWAISVPRSKQTAAKTLAQKALSCGIPGIQVDGMDVLAVAAVTAEAAARARRGEGATLIEAVTYRYGNHTTSDDSGKYRKKEEVEEWRPRDPMIRLKLYLQKNNLWSEEWEQKIRTEAEVKIRTAVEKAEAFPAPKPEEVFDYMYAEMPPALQQQKDYLVKLHNN